MKSRRFILLVIALGLAGAIAWIPRSPSHSRINLKGSGTAVEVSMDLGQIYNGQDATASLSLVNKSGANLLLHTEAGCACTSVKLGRGSLSAGESTELEIRYRSEKRPNRLGKVQEKFIVADTSNSTSMVKVVGMVDVFVKPSVTFNPPHLEWHLGPDGPEPKLSQVTVKNETASPLTLRHRQPADPLSDAFVYTVAPEQLTLGPGQEASLAISSVKLVENQPFAGQVQFVADFAEASKAITLSHSYPLRILPRYVVSATPGSLIFSEQELKNATAKTLKFRANNGKPLTIKAITSRDGLTTLQRQADNTYQVTPARNLPAPSISDVIQVEYQVDGMPGRLVVPVLGIAP